MWVWEREEAIPLAPFQGSDAQTLASRISDDDADMKSRWRRHLATLVAFERQASGNARLLRPCRGLANDKAF